MAVLPLIFLIQPLVAVFTLDPAACDRAQPRASLLLYLLVIPALVPSTLAAYSVVGEREQGTLEPVLTTPIRREEFLLGKALAACVPTLAIAYAVFGIFLACVELFAHPAWPRRSSSGPDVLAQLLFTPLLAGWSIWVGIAISARSQRRPRRPAARDPREPAAAGRDHARRVQRHHGVTRLAVGRRPPCWSSTCSAGGSVAAMFDRERLIIGTKG